MVVYLTGDVGGDVGGDVLILLFGVGGSVRSVN
jgi:hypothetical protein